MAIAWKARALMAEAHLLEARAQIAAKDAEAAVRDAMLHGTGVMQGGKHVPVEAFYKDERAYRIEELEAQIAEGFRKMAAKDEFFALAIKERDEARAQIAAKDARVRVLAVALEYALQKMWEYGFTENDLQPVRNALSIPKPRRLTPEEAGEIADSIEASLKGQDNG